MICIIECFLLLTLFFFKQKTAYEMRISDWSSDVCSSDLLLAARPVALEHDLAPVGRETAADVDARRGRQAYRRPAVRRDAIDVGVAEIGRASCRERVCQYV